MASKMVAISLKFQLFAHQSSEMTYFDALSLDCFRSNMSHSVLHTHHSQNISFEIQDRGPKIAAKLRILKK